MRLGEILQSAALISAAQLEVAVHNQHQADNILLGEILALHGWIKQDTADFFAEQWPKLVQQIYRQQRIGDYLKSAALLNETQINSILKEQWQTGVKFGNLAVVKGWLKPATVDFFLTYLFPEQRSKGALIGRRQTKVRTKQGTAATTSPSQEAIIQSQIMLTNPDEDITWLN